MSASSAVQRARATDVRRLERGTAEYVALVFLLLASGGATIGWLMWLLH